jgi:hypothetical protein
VAEQRGGGLINGPHRQISKQHSLVCKGESCFRFARVSVKFASAQISLSIHPFSLISNTEQNKLPMCAGNKSKARFNPEKNRSI